jgi:monofunctional biosynthetic peptidoglycan transglycosylase
MFSMMTKARSVAPAHHANRQNLFLWDGRSFIRKGLEIPIAYWMDLVFSSAA